MSSIPRLIFLLSIIVTASCAEPSDVAVGADVGLVAPDISGKLPAGRDFNLNALRGKPVVLDFWGTWCGPCIREAPELVKLHQDFMDDIHIVSIALEKVDDGRSETVAERLGFSWPNRLTEKIAFVRFSQSAGLYDVTDIPSTFLIDENGVIILAKSNVKEVRTYLTKDKMVKGH